VPRQRSPTSGRLRGVENGDDPRPSWDIGQEHEGEQTFLRAGLGTDVLGKLRRGHWKVQAELDLHGHDSEEAHDALADFLVDARSSGMRCVRVIHGKGLTSPNREPVLKGKVRRWLARWDDVLAYSEAPPHAGGGGAVMVLLRGR
jgi:DNA-nicking Smr family endonuclease